MAKESNWSDRELAVIERFARALRDGEFRSGLAAARACQRGLERLRQARRRAGPALPVRTLGAVHFRLRLATRAFYAELPFRRRQSDEMRVVRRYVRAFLAGRYLSMRAAAVACARELARTARRPRPFYGVYWMVHSTAHATGVPKLKSEWAPAERRVLARYLRRLFEGRYRYPYEAARDCHRELGGSRTYKAVRFALVTGATRTGLPRFRGYFTLPEMRLVERYALKVHRGQLPDWLAAARQCHAALLRLNERLARTSPLRLRRISGHSLGGVHAAIRLLAHRRGLRGPRNPHWTAAENSIMAGWLKWYGRYRHVLRLAPLRQAGEGLHSDLANRGFHRTIGACRAKVSTTWRLQALR